MGDSSANMAIETTKPWDEMDAYERKVITVVHAQGFRDGGVDVTEERMLRILTLGSPKCVFAYQGDELKYARVHKDSVKIMKLLCNQYLEKSFLEENEEEIKQMLDDAKEGI
ncbi:hypothetical protein [Maribacter sp. 4G9]|uniref:hypothetical protein n=1 Tax=Maribacter sp. 4G9 TaxID=1889777 RepID=UPI000C150597|nr:hypothetical protein [Maribacter sp. 4G9]PIB39053.1 hypothetical protein BFP75_00835 [Maribacter sp. 4G9]